MPSLVKASKLLCQEGSRGASPFLLNRLLTAALQEPGLQLLLAQQKLILHQSSYSTTTSAAVGL